MKPFPQTVFIVEDDPSIREVLQECLASEGFITEEAENGKVALEKLATQEKPLVILLDMMMPVMGGRKFLEIIRLDVNLKSVPVIVVSANASLKDIGSVQAFLRKPIDFELLVKTIKRFQSSTVLEA